ncbi:GH36 C-terminal domain-containing protein [uncultured Clostridium sp.]|uniref:GH36 C-terminal domain-containing protein n=1 Tax=Clostridium sp. TaxID=1506 RepID=UPI002670AE86|nr:GH36 C-terminal domain-containing protein [uncultured Clostridium sp.]
MGIAVRESNKVFINTEKDESKGKVNGKRLYVINDFSENKVAECIEVISKDKLEVVLVLKGIDLCNISNFKRLKLMGLREDAIYKNIRTQEVFLGGSLMNLGVDISKLRGNIEGSIIYLKAI